MAAPLKTRAVFSWCTDGAMLEVLTCTSCYAPSPKYSAKFSIFLEHFQILKLKQIRFILELLGPHRFRNVREAVSCNFVLLSSNMHLVAPIHDEKTVLKNGLVANFGR